MPSFLVVAMPLGEEKYGEEKYGGALEAEGKESYEVIDTPWMDRRVFEGIVEEVAHFYYTNETLQSTLEKFLGDHAGLITEEIWQSQEFETEHMEYVAWYFAHSLELAGLPTPLFSLSLSLTHLSHISLPTLSHLSTFLVRSSLSLSLLISCRIEIVK